MLLLLFLQLLLFFDEHLLLDFFSNLGFSFFDLFALFFDLFLFLFLFPLLLLIINLLLFHSLINHPLCGLKGRMNDLLSIHLALNSENEPHEHVIQLVADQLQLVDHEVILLRVQAALET